jgi:hypothetical protein
MVNTSASSVEMRSPLLRGYTAPAHLGVYRENARGNTYWRALFFFPCMPQRTATARKQVVSVSCTWRGHTHEMGPWSDVASRDEQRCLLLLLRDEARGKM